MTRASLRAISWQARGKDGDGDDGGEWDTADGDEGLGIGPGKGGDGGEGSGEGAGLRTRRTMKEADRLSRRDGASLARPGWSSSDFECSFSWAWICEGVVVRGRSASPARLSWSAMSRSIMPRSEPWSLTWSWCCRSRRRNSRPDGVPARSGRSGPARASSDSAPEDHGSSDSTSASSSCRGPSVVRRRFPA